jgi:hypothetical protein
MRERKNEIQFIAFLERATICSASSIVIPGGIRRMRPLLAFR